VTVYFFRRHLVRAHVKSGSEGALLEAIQSETIGQGSVAEGEYLRGKAGREALSRWYGALGRGLLLPDSAAGRGPYW